MYFYVGKNADPKGKMLRDILLSLEKWSSSPTRRSLVLRGARQVGKTWTIRELARRLGLTLVEVNFERQVSARQAFDGDLDPEVVLKNLEINLNTAISRQNTLAPETSYIRNKGRCLDPSR